MKTILVPLLATLVDLLRSRASLHLETLALRQQLAILANRDNKRHRFRPRERISWVWLYRLWPTCLRTLAIFKQDTLVRWHRKGFRLYWTWKSRRRCGGRPAIDPEVRKLIRTMSQNNIGWGAPRIHGELTKCLVSRYPSLTVAQFPSIWFDTAKTPFADLADVSRKSCSRLGMAGIDFFTVPDRHISHSLYVFIVLQP